MLCNNDSSPLLVAGEDLNVTSPTTELTFSSGVSDGHSECVQINIIDDDVYEENQQFLVSITRVSTSLPLLAVEELANVYTLEDNGGMLLYGQLHV